MRFLSNYSHVSSHYKFALSQYEMAYKKHSDDYMLVLCIAVMYVNMACVRKQPPVRNAVTTQVSSRYREGKKVSASIQYFNCFCLLGISVFG